MIDTMPGTGPSRDGAATRPGPGFLAAPFAARTWREFLYHLLSLPVAVAAFCTVVTLTALGAGLVLSVLGLPVLAAALYGARMWGALERARAAALLDVHLGRPAPLRPRRPGLAGLLGAPLRDGLSWRSVLYCLVALPWAALTFAVSLPLWLYGWALLTYPAWQWVFPAWTGRPGLQICGCGPDRANVYLDSTPEIAATCTAGLLLVLVTPWVLHGMAWVNRALVRALLSPS